MDREELFIERQNSKKEEQNIKRFDFLKMKLVQNLIFWK